MRVHLAEGIVLVQLGRQFGAPDARRLREIVLSFAPISKLTLDFALVREFHDAAFAPLAETLRGLSATEVVLRGHTVHQSRMLKYFGVAQPAPAGGLAVGLAPA